VTETTAAARGRRAPARSPGRGGRAGDTLRPVVRLAVLAAMLCGCAQLFGLDETSGGPRPPSLIVERVSVGARLTYAPQDLSASTGTYLVPNDAEPTGLVRVVAAQAEAGRWTAPITGATPILFDLPDYPKPIQRIYDFPQPDVKALFGVLEHPNPQPAPAGATITLNVTLDAAFTGAEKFELYTLGSWNRLPGLNAPVNNVLTQTFPFTMMSSLTGRPHEKITAEDGVVVLRYAANDQLLGALKAAPFDQTGTDTISGTMTTVTAQAQMFGIDRADLLTRYSSVRPYPGTPTLSWAVRAAPAAQLANESGPLLAGGPATDPTTVMFQAGNPFEPDWPSLAVFATQAQRTYTPPTAGLQATLVTAMSERALLQPGLQMRLTAGLPKQIRIGDTLLETDGAMLPKPSRAIEVTFATDVESNTLYQLQLFKLVPNAGNTALQAEQKISALGPEARFVLPPELFEMGGLYTLRAVANQGCFPAAAAGDLTERSLPCATSFVDSGVFQVTP